MTPLQQIIVTSIASILGSGVLVAIITAIFNRRRLIAESKKLDSETVSTLVQASGYIVSQFKLLIDESEHKFQLDIEELRQEILEMRAENERLQQAYLDLRTRYNALLVWSTSLVDYLECMGIEYEKPPKCFDLLEGE